MLCDSYAYALDPWQRGVLDAWGARDILGEPLYLTCGLSCPRQNGKNSILEACELYKLLVCNEHILHTAHLVKTAATSFRKLVAIVTNTRNEDIHSKVTNIRYGNGEQAIYFDGGGLIEYSARSRGASRGASYNLVVYDEAQELTDEQLEASLSVLAASPTGRQIIYTGTPPCPSSPGTVFARIRKSAVQQKAARTCWHEWSVVECPPPPSRFDDLVDACYDTNPALGIRLDLDFTKEEFDTMSLDGFARERLGWWSEQSVACAINSGMWHAAQVDKAHRPTKGKRAFGVKFSPDGGIVALCGCRLEDEKWAHVELVGASPADEGLGWLCDFLCDEERADTVAAVAVDGRSGADALLDRLAEVYPRQALPAVGTRGVVAAATMFHEALRDGYVTHLDDPSQQYLDNSALTCIKRPIGSDGAWAYGGADSAPIEAASLAYWAAKTSKRDPDGGCVIL